MSGSAVRSALATGAKYQRHHHANLFGNIFSNAPKLTYTVSTKPCFAMNTITAPREFSSQEVTKNLRLMTQEDEKPKVDPKSLVVEVRKGRTLVVFLEWMAAQKNHVKKFTDLYLDSGYDVLVAPLTPSQLLFPTKGSQVVAAEVAQFLANNKNYSCILVHGFSIGGYVWGEVQLLMSRDTSRYSSVIQRIHGQVWDSVVGLESIIKGFPLAIFPRNVFLRTAFSKYLGFTAYSSMFQHFDSTRAIPDSVNTSLVADELIKFLAENTTYKKVIVHGFSVGGYLWGEVCLRINQHPALPQQVVGQVWDSLVDVVGVGHGVAASLFPKNDVLRRIVQSFIQMHLWLFHNIATKHYKASSACFRDPPVKAPALVLASKKDPICSFKEMMEVVDGWREQKCQVTVKLWEDSPHVGHFRKHRQEYVSELNNFLKSLQLPTVQDSEVLNTVSSKL